MRKLIPIRSGPWDLLFSKEDGAIRHIRVDGCEVLLGIYAAVRDRNWGTVPPRLANLDIATGDGQVTIAFAAHCEAAPISYVWQGRITVHPEQGIRYSFEGRALSSFLRNRIGFCVLHGADCAGWKCRTESPDGTTSEGVFPIQIAPHQPFKNLSGITYWHPDDLEVGVRMEGEVFETEDQRNWTDASFKTYCTPLDLPFPVPVETGEVVRQKVTLQVHSGSARRPQNNDPVVVLSPSGQHLRWPSLGVQASGDDVPKPDQSTLERIRSLGLFFMRVDIRPARNGWKSRLRRALSEAAACDLFVEVALHLPADSSPSIVKAVQETFLLVKPRPLVVRWLVFKEGLAATGAPWTDLVREQIRQGPFEAFVYGGTDANFTELNRHRPAPASVDGLTFAINPQVHAFDDLSLIETLRMQAVVSAQAASFAPGQPVSVSPITLKPRFNPVATAVEKPQPGRIPASVDPRQHTVFAALWTLLSMRHLAVGGATSACYYESCGWRGIVDTAAAAPPTPLEILFRFLAGHRHDPLEPLASSHPLLADGLTLHSPGRRAVLVACFSEGPEPTGITLAGIQPAAARALLGGAPSRIDGGWHLAPLSLTLFNLDSP